MLPDFAATLLVDDLLGSLEGEYLQHGENSASLAGTRARLRLLITDEAAPGGGTCRKSTRLDSASERAWWTQVASTSGGSPTALER